MTIKRTMILKYQLVFFAINKLLANGEWVEMPQFSDDSKVYKLSVHDDGSFYNKFTNNDQKIVPDYDVKNIKKFLNEFGNADRNSSGEISIHQTENSAQFSDRVTINSSNLSKDSADVHANDGDDIITANFDPKVDISINAEASTPAVPSTLEIPTEGPSISSTAIPILLVKKSQSYSSEREECNNETLKGMKFQDYLPMEMLNKVHQTLKSQPSTLKGKIRFLKQFEKDLISEIEARLGTALTPPRRRRGTHDYYDHDDGEMGFPSLEGALMAISFLTFAVYLVRLVMLLFRNVTNNTTSATILFGRNRRSTDIDTINKKTQEILNYLNNFDTD